MFIRYAIVFGSILMTATSLAQAGTFMIEDTFIGQAPDPDNGSTLTCDQLVQGYLASIYAHTVEGPGFLTLPAIKSGNAAEPAPAAASAGRQYGLPTVLTKDCDTPATLTSDSHAEPHNEAYTMAWLRQAGASMLASAKLPSPLQRLASTAAFDHDDSHNTPHARAGRYPRRTTRRVGPARRLLDAALRLRLMPRA